MGWAKNLVIVASIFLVGCVDQPTDSSPNTAIAPGEPSEPSIQYVGWVTDAAGVLSEAEEAHLSRKLEGLEVATKHQMVVVTVPTLEGRDIANFTTDLVNAWKVGRKNYNDGVVLLVAPAERKVRIGVGYGLEGTLTNAVCTTIIQETMVPHFRTGGLYVGIDAGVDALVEALS